MHAEDLFVDQGCNGEAVKTVGKNFPQLDAMAALALVVKSVNAIDRRALVVAAQEEEVLRVFYFVRQQQTHSLQRLLSAVDVVAKEEVGRLWREAAVFKKPQ